MVMLLVSSEKAAKLAFAKKQQQIEKKSRTYFEVSLAIKCIDLKIILHMNQYKTI